MTKGDVQPRPEGLDRFLFDVSAQLPDPNTEKLRLRK